MTTFDKREKDRKRSSRMTRKLQFRAPNARRNKLLGLWAPAKSSGFQTDQQANAYAKEGS